MRMRQNIKMNGARGPARGMHSRRPPLFHLQASPEACQDHLQASLHSSPLLAATPRPGSAAKWPHRPGPRQAAAEAETRQQPPRKTPGHDQEKSGPTPKGAELMVITHDPDDDG